MIFDVTLGKSHGNARVSNAIKTLADILASKESPDPVVVGSIQLLVGVASQNSLLIFQPIELY